MTKSTLILMLVCATPLRASAQTVFTDWTEIGPAQDTAVGLLGSLPVTITASYPTAIRPGVLDGTSTNFAFPIFSPPLAQSDSLSLAADIFSDTRYTVTFGSPVQNPVMHLDSVFGDISFSDLAVTRLSGETTFTVRGDTVFGGRSDTRPASQAGGTVQLLGTFSSFNFTAHFAPASVDFFEFQVGIVPVPEPSVPLLSGIGAVLLCFHRGCRRFIIRGTRRATMPPTNQASH